VISGKRLMIVHNDRLEEVETPVKYFETWITPIDAFLSGTTFQNRHPSTSLRIA
jgi:hypothetical protein